MTVVFKDVSRRFTGRDREASVLALDNVSLEISKGECVVLLGPSGCGKTTLLKMLGGFDSPSAGTVTLDGVPIKDPGPDRGTIFQAPTLFPWLSVLDNVLYGPRMCGKYSDQMKVRAYDLLRTVGLENFADFMPSHLSGGMQQRVAIARVLINDPSVILADEPFAALDEYTRRSMQELFIAATSTGGQAMLFVTHSVEEAVFLADRIVVMSPRPGRIRSIVEVGLPRPRDRASREFLDRMGEIFQVIRHDVAAANETQLEPVA
jgi:NitT/TauT family transport system ATP-binding protein